MANEDNQNDAPQWFNEFKDQMGQVLGGITQQQQAMGQQIAQASQPAPEAAASPQPGLSDERLLNDLVNSPSKFISELDNVITQKAAAQTQTAIQQAEENRRIEEAAQKFEAEFFTRNPELKEYRALVIDKMQKQPVHLEPNAKADAAAEEVRALLKTAQADAIENERRQRASALRAGGSQGLRAAVEEGDGASSQSEAERQQAAFEEERAWRNSRL